MKKITRSNSSYWFVSLLGGVLLSACGTMPLPSVHQSVAVTPVKSAEEKLFEETSSDKIAAVGREETPDLVEAVVEPKQPQRPVLSSAKAYMRQGVNYLQTGDREGARWALLKALEMKPGYKTANKLLLQLDDDPKEKLGEQSFDYQLQYGDSLSKLSQQYLDDPLLFYLLARYNDIDNPSEVKIGQRIRIPGTSAPVVADDDVAISDSSYTKAKGLYELGKYKETIAALENSMDEMGLTDDELNAINKLMTNAFIQQASLLEKQQQFLSAKELLQRASQLQPGNMDIRFHLESLNAGIEVEQYFQQGMKAIAENRHEEAFRAFDKVLSLEPEHKQAKAKRQELFLSVADALYKRALIAQRRQDLDGAIMLWDEFLEMMPDNENARLYREKAVRMKNNLKKFAAQ